MDPTNNDKEIEKILAEAPVEIEQPKENLQPKKKKKLNKKMIIYASIAIIIIVVGFMILPLGDCKDENCTLDVTKTNQDFVDSMKQQIINKGYAEIKDGSNILKLAPYIN